MVHGPESEDTVPRWAEREGRLLREPNDEGPVWIRLVYRYGVPAAIALFLVWSMTGNVVGEVRITRTLLEMHIQEQRFYLKAICLNTAHDDVQRQLCQPPELR